MSQVTETHDVPDCGCSEYNELSRRQFLTGIVGTAAAVAPFPDWLPRVVLAESYAASRDVLLSIFLRGGADGLSLCVPFADPNYYASRATIAIPRPDAAGTGPKGLALDNFFAFPPALAALMPAYLARHLLVVHATGQFNNSRSHFDAQRFMEVGKPLDPVLSTGWLGRHLASTPPVRTTAPLRALGLAAGLQKTLVGGPKTLPIADPTNFALGGSVNTQAARLAALSAEYASAADGLKAAALDAAQTVQLLRTVNFTGYVPANGAVYPNTTLGRALRAVAVLIKADVGIEAAQVDVGGWDTHANQAPLAGSMSVTMTDFANSLAAFYADVMGGTSTTPVTAIAVSEFGRNVRENGSLGTDHGRGTVMFALGRGIAGGRVLVDQWPGLARENLEAGQDLKVTIDYRDILAEIVQKRLGNPALDYVFPGWTPTMRGVTV